MKAPTKSPKSPASRKLPATFLRRVLAYAHATGIRFEAGVRHAGWGELGLPDLRGFTPHRRTVRLFAGEAPRFPRAADTPIEELTTAQLWLLHDLLHVVWYDFATVAFGRAAWSGRDFFLEHHLASEAFAVALLDYHVLSGTKHHGLAVEVADEEWAGLRAAVPALPELRSYSLCRELVTHYLTGQSRLFRGKLATRADVADRIARWRDHEVSYSDKQRWYVFLWWDDLQATKLTDRRAVVANSPASELVWLALRLFTVDSEADFGKHLARATGQLHGGEQLFAELPKYRTKPAPRPSPAAADAQDALDFRFTDIAALAVDEVAELVRATERPSAPRLFLLWQLLALEPPDSLKPVERAAVARLAKSVQTPSVDRRAWKEVRGLCERRIAHAKWKVDESLRGTFFLP